MCPGSDPLGVCFALCQSAVLCTTSHFLCVYLVQKADCVAQKQAARDCLCDYDYEGQGSPAGSVGCCSLLEADNDLHFLDDLGTKFKTLAEICSPPRPPTPQPIVTPEVERVDHIAVPSLEAKPPSIRAKSPERNQDVSITQSSTSTGVKSLNRRSTSSMQGRTSTSVKSLSRRSTSSIPAPSHMGFNGRASSNMHGQSSHYTSSMAQSPHMSPVTTAMLPSTPQMLLLQQQPVYYSTTPMMQPMHYIVQPQLQSPMLMADGSVSNMHGMFLQGGNPAGFVTLGGTRGDRVVEENLGMGAWPHGPVMVTGVRKNGRRIKSEGGAQTWQMNNKGARTGRRISEGGAVLAGGQLVFTQPADRRRRSTALVETEFEEGELVFTQPGDRRRRSTALVETAFMY